MNDNTTSKANLWADRILTFQESGLSRKEWCLLNEIPQSTLRFGNSSQKPLRQHVLLILCLTVKLSFLSGDGWPSQSLEIYDINRIERLGKIKNLAF